MLFEVILLIAAMSSGALICLNILKRCKKKEEIKAAPPDIKEDKYEILLKNIDVYDGTDKGQQRI